MLIFSAHTSEDTQRQGADKGPYMIAQAHTDQAHLFWSRVILHCTRRRLDLNYQTAQLLLHPESITRHQHDDSFLGLEDFHDRNLSV